MKPSKNTDTLLYYNNTCDFDLVEPSYIVTNNWITGVEMYKIKSKYRNIKTILEIDIDESKSTKCIIKELTNGGFDGIILCLGDIYNIGRIIEFCKILKQLPQPYDFNWTIIIKVGNSVILEDNLTKLKIYNVKYIVDIKNIEDYNINSKNLLINTSNINNSIFLHFIKHNNKISGIYTTKSEQLKLVQNEAHKQINNLNYPSSSYIKSINESEIMDIIELYRSSEDIFKVTIDIDFSQ